MAAPRESRLLAKSRGRSSHFGGAAAGSLKRAGTTTINTVTPLAPKAVVQAAKGVKDAVKDVKDDIEGLVVELTPAQAAEVAAATKALAVGAGAFTRKVFTNPKQAATEISTLLGDAGKGTAAALSLIQALGASNVGLESVLQVCESLAESASSASVPHSSASFVHPSTSLSALYARPSAAPL